MNKNVNNQPPSYQVQRNNRRDFFIGLILLLILLACGAYLYNAQNGESDNSLSSSVNALPNNEPDAALLAKALQGDKEAQYAVGRFYMHRNDWANAIVWYEKSAAQGYGKALSNLGVAYAEGYAVAQDLNKACAYFEQAHAILNSDISTANLAICYDNHKKDFHQAFALYLQAAKKGMVQEQRLLGQMYDRGEGTAENKELAVYWYRQSAKQNDAQAFLLLATKYLFNDGVKPHANNRAAAYILMKAAQAKRSPDDKEWFDENKFDERLTLSERNMNAMQHIRKWALEHDLRQESPQTILARIDEMVPYQEPDIAELERITAEQTAAQIAAGAISASAASR